MITATGIVTIGIRALGMCHRKIRMISETMTSSSSSVCFRLSIDLENQLERS